MKKIEFIEFLCFLYLFYLVPRLIICLHFIFLMTGRALNLTLKLVMCHDEFKKVKGGVLRDVLVEV